MRKSLSSLLPAKLIHFAGRLQFRVPFLAPLINKAGELLASGEDIIQRGAGKGLRFDATDCNPGYLLGTSDPLEQETLIRHLPRGGVFYDLGANAGFYTVIAARHVGKQGQVYAFDPTPEAAARVRRNATLNGFRNLTVVEAAVSDEVGTLSFAHDGFSTGNTLNERSAGNRIQVQSITLDAWMQEHRAPDVIMVDTEGAEIRVLQGAMNLIREHRPVIMVEVHWLGEKFTRFVAETLEPLGYTATTFTGDPVPTDLVRCQALLKPSSR